MKKNEARGFQFLTDKTMAICIWLGVLFSFAVISWFQIPIEVFPKENVPSFLYVSTQLKANSAIKEVETLVALPIEGMINTLTKVLSRSLTISENSVAASITFRPNADLDLITVELMEKMQSLEAAGLIDLRKVSILKFNPDAVAVIQLSVTGQSDVSTFAKDELAKSIESLPEVSKVEVQGAEPNLYRWTLSNKNLKEYSVPPRVAASALKPEVFTEPLGELELGDNNISISGRMGKLNVNEIGKLSIMPNATLELQNLAKLEIIRADEKVVFHQDGAKSIFLEIFNKDSANLFELRRGLDQLLSKLKEEHKGILSINTIYDRTTDLRAGIKDVLDSLYQSILITSIVIFVYFRHFWLTALVSLTIPLSLILTVLFMYIKGSTLNLLSLSGLILSIGLVVDNAVVVIERMQFWKRSGFSKKASIANGAGEMAGPLLMSTLSTILIFLPAAFIESGDPFIDILKAFQLPMIGSLLSALMLAVVFVPIAYLLVHESLTYQATRQGFDSWIEERAVPIFKWLQSKQVPVSVCCLFVVGLVAWTVKDIESVDLEVPRDPFVQTAVKFSAEVPSSERKALFLSLEKNLLESQKSLGYRSLVGEFDPQFLSGQFTFYPLREPATDVELNELASKVKAFLNQRPPQVGLSTAILGDENFSFDFSGMEESLRFNFQGNTWTALSASLEHLKVELSKLAGVRSVEDMTQERGKNVFVLKLKPGSIEGSGLNREGLASIINSFEKTLTINGVSSPQGPVNATIQITESEDGHLSKEQFLSREIAPPDNAKPGRNSVFILGDSANLTQLKVLSSLSRKEGLVEAPLIVTLAAATSAAEKQKLKEQINQVIREFSWPPGSGPVSGKNNKALEEMEKNSQFMLLLSGFLIYLLMASLFESILIPIAVMFTVPLALVFAVFGLWTFGMPIDVMSRFSLVLLVGVGVNNAILLVDVIESLRKRGFPLKEAIAQGCAQRLTAVLLSTGMTILGVLPVALGNSKIMGIPYSSLGIAMISGMIFSTIITLLLIPAVYSLLQSLAVNSGQKSQASRGSDLDQAHLKKQLAAKAYS